MLSGFVGCTDEANDQPERNVDFCVKSAWQNGLAGGTTRTLSVTDILADGTGGIVINTDDYPANIDVTCSNGTDFTLTKSSNLCSEHGSGFLQYTPSVNYTDKKIISENYTFDFTATIDNGDELVGTSTKADIRNTHMLVALHHTKSLLRFAFKLSERYDNIRFVKVTGINLNGKDCYVKDAVLAKDKLSYIAYAYVDPKVVTISKDNNVVCTYNIYDRDNATTDHLTREGVKANNTFKLGSLKDTRGDGVTELRAGYYYDLHVTLNPDYLYVMAEHDNKHMTVE